MADPKPAPLHTDHIGYARRVTDGKIPEIWSKVEGQDAYKAAAVAIIAWEQVRDPADPPFPACSVSHRERLLAEVESIIKVGPPQSDAETPFTQAVQAVLADINRAEQLRLDGETEQGDVV